VLASNPHRETRGNCGGCYAPMRRHNDRRVVSISADGKKRSKIGDKLALAAERRSIPERIGRVDLIDGGKHHPDRLRVRLAPERKMRGWKMGTEWRGERRGEHEVTKVVETKDENSARLADMALHVSRD